MSTEQYNLNHLTVPSFSDSEELEVASDVPSSEDSLEQPTTPSTMVPGNVGFKLLSALLTVSKLVRPPISCHSVLKHWTSVFILVVALQSSIIM